MNYINNTKIMDSTLIDIVSAVSTSNFIQYLSFFVLLPVLLQSRSLFVKNLNFKTADESLKKHFSEHMKEGRIQSVRVTI